MNFRGICSLALGMVIVAGAASAEKVPYHGDTYGPDGGCVTDGYKSFSGPGGMFIPDCDPAGVSQGVATEDDGATIDDVILAVEMDHTWVGDLRIWLSYDMNCDGTAEAGPVAALCRPGLGTCDPDGCCGCSAGVFGVYLFSDDGGVPLAEDCVAVDPGCYSAAIDSPNPFAVFDGMPKGGCFELFAADGACADTGSVRSWTVYVANGGGGTPTETVSWGHLKSSY